jgi:hypothetical protein
METIEAPKALSPSAERMRRHRERRRSGFRCVTVQLREREIAELVRRGLLKPEDRSQPVAIVNAFHAYLDQAFPAQQ